MGIDLKAGGRRVGHNQRKAPVSKNVYVKLLEKLYSFIARRGDSKFAETIMKRLRMSQLNKAPLSISRLARSTDPLLDFGVARDSIGFRKKLRNNAKIQVWASSSV